MKKLLTTLLTLSSLIAFGQVPQGFSYQAVAFNSAGSPVVSSAVSVRISILDNSASGTTLYTETHSKTTNASGLYNLTIGQGTPTLGTFTSINWTVNSKFVKVELDPTGGTAYTTVGTSQFLSVPYALIADSAIRNKQEFDPVYNNSLASKITANDTIRWNKKLDSFQELQTLTDVLIKGSNANQQIKKVSDPTDTLDAVNKKYVDKLKSKILDLQVQIGVYDIDGNFYKTVRICNQVWMASNLKTTKFNDGTTINYLPDSIAWYNTNNPAYCFTNNIVSNDTIYGKLYNGNTIINQRNICPKGWRIPTTIDLEELFNCFSSISGSTLGGLLKEVGTSHWKSPNTGATDSFGFKALPAGRRIATGPPSYSAFNNPTYIGTWWLVNGTFKTYNNINQMNMNNASSGISVGSESNKSGATIRCISDQ